MRRFIVDGGGLFTCEVEVEGDDLDRAAEHEQVESLLGSAVTLSLAVLVEGSPWLDQLEDQMNDFMLRMKQIASES